jgi:hypothetical protein
VSILRTMGECPVRLCAYVYPDAGGNGDYGHLFNKGLITQGLARTATLPAPAVESSSEGWSKSGRRRTPDLEIPAPLWNGNNRRRVPRLASPDWRLPLPTQPFRGCIRGCPPLAAR